MSKPKPPRASGPPLYPITGRLATVPTFLMMQLMRTSMAYRGAIRAQLPTDAIDEDADLRFPHYAALEILQEHGAMSQKELSQRLRFDASDLVGIVDELEARKLVNRVRDEHDRRRYQLGITPQAIRKVKERARDADLMTEMFFAPLSKTELEAFCEMLLRLDEHHREHFDDNARELAKKLSKLHDTR